MKCVLPMGKSYGEDGWNFFHTDHMRHAERGDIQCLSNIGAEVSTANNFLMDCKENFFPFLKASFYCNETNKCEST